MVRQSVTLESAPSRVEPLLEQIVAIANLEKEALGFIPQGAYPDAAKQKRIIVAIDGSGTVLGYLLHGGVFPHGSVQQLGVRNDVRRQGIASKLVQELIARLEREGFLTVKARVASDLPVAQAFYTQHGFESVAIAEGGEARGRTINVRVRQLDTPSLLDASGTAIDWTSPVTPLAVRRATAGEVPFYAIDLNVFFDLVRDRARSKDAHHLFNAALTHAIRIAIAPEFIGELRRTSSDSDNDALLQLALQLPRLPKSDDRELSEAAAEIHRMVFEITGAPTTVQSRSDARHVAHAVLVGAAGFITSDRTILNSKEALRERFGVDVAPLDELVSLLPAQADQAPHDYYGEGFSCQPIAVDDAKQHLMILGASSEMLDVFCQKDGLNRKTHRFAIFENETAIGIGVLRKPSTMDEPARLLVQVPQHHPSADLFAEHLIEVLMRTAAADRAAWLQLSVLPGQTVILRVAKANGFFEANGTLSKVALGRPLTLSNWGSSAAHLRRRLGLELPERMPSGASVTLKDADGCAHEISFESVESLFGPTLLAYGDRQGVIVSIERQYADELLGTSDQGTFAFVQSRPAAFLSRRAYVCSPRNAAVLQNSRPILFYESQRSGGRGAIVAVARIVDSLVQPKSAVSTDSRRRLVVDDVSEFSATDDVLVVSFDGILTFPRPFTLRELAGINATGSSNLQAATPISAENLNKVLDAAWS